MKKALFNDQVKSMDGLEQEQFRYSWLVGSFADDFVAGDADSAQVIWECEVSGLPASFYVFVSHNSLGPIWTLEITPNIFSPTFEHDLRRGSSNKLLLWLHWQGVSLRFQ